MATAIYTTPRCGTEPTYFTVRAFLILTASLQDVIDSEKYLETVALDEGVDIMGIQDETISAWHRADAATSAFLRANREAEAARPLVAVAERVETMLSLIGLEERADLFSLVTRTMLDASKRDPGDVIGDLISDMVLVMYDISIYQSVFLPEDAEDLEPIAA